MKNSDKIIPKTKDSSGLLRSEKSDDRNKIYTGIAYCFEYGQKSRNKHGSREFDTHGP